MMTQINQDSVKSPDGRFGRCSWLAWQMVLVLWLIPLFLGLVVASPFLHPHNVQEWMLWIVYPVIFIYLLVLLYFSIIFTIRRLHDLNHSGWFTVLIAIPLLNLLFFFYLACAKGNASVNHYGSVQPLHRWEKFLATLYVLLSIYLLVVLAIAVYDNHQIMLLNTQVTAR
jgi:uncharacterized membrane protein YhaH (DUF805 family)